MQTTLHRQYVVDGMPFLTVEEMFKRAPAIFAEHQAAKCSAKYSFIPTLRVLKVLTSMGWYPVTAFQGRSYKADRTPYKRHTVVFRHKNWADRDETIVPEILLRTSHDTTTAFSFNVSIFDTSINTRYVVKDNLNNGFSVRHMGYTDDQVVEAVNKLIAEFASVQEKIKQFRAVTLTSEQQLLLAGEAIKVRWKGFAPVAPLQLLQSNTYGNPKPDLWHVFKRIHRNLLKGGMLGVTPNSHRRIVRSIKNVDKNIDINKSLWALANTYNTSATA